MVQTIKRSKLSTIFISLWILCVIVFVTGLLYSIKHPYNVKNGEPTPLRAWLMLVDVIVGVLFFSVGVRFWILEKRRGSSVIRVMWKLGFIGVFLIPTIMVMIIFLDNDGSQWIIYPIFFVCLIPAFIFKVIVKKIIFPKKKLPRQP